VHRLTLILSVLFLLSSLLVACGEEDARTISELGGGTPTITKMQQSSLVVGEPLSFYGENFLGPHEGKTKLVFEGIYVWTDKDGKEVVENVPGLVVAPLYDGEFEEDGSVLVEQGGNETQESVPAGTRVLRWNRFGPFDVPFTHEGNKTGVFKGTVSATNYHLDGTVDIDEDPSHVAIEVQPSVLITKLEPVVGLSAKKEIRTAQCDGPALRAHGGLPYILEVEAVGFEPTWFFYRLCGVNNKEGFVEFDHQPVYHASAPGRDRLGDPSWPAWKKDEIVVFNPVSDTEEYSIAAIRITVIDANNNAYHTALPLSVIRPMHFYHDGDRKLAEYYEPEVVHGPVPGAIGTVVTYAESQSETRQRGVSVGMSDNWTKGQAQTKNTDWSEGVSQTNSLSATNARGESHSEGESSQETYGSSYASSETNKVDFSSSTGTDWGWNKSESNSSEEFKSHMGEIYGDVSAEVSSSVTGEGSVPGIAKVSGTVGTKVGVSAGAKTGDTTGDRRGSQETSGSHMYESESESQAFGSATTDGRSESVSGTFGLTSQTNINSSTSATQAKSDSTTYQMGGSEGLAENYSVGSQKTWQETFVNSEAVTKSFSNSSKVPRGRCAVVYRQTVRYVRTAQLYTYDLCGVRELAGELSFNEWTWSPSIEIGDDCQGDSLPDSSLPRAECFEACR
jgi:hypothetical protein